MLRHFYIHMLIGDHSMLYGLHIYYSIILDRCVAKNLLVRNTMPHFVSIYMFIGT